MVPHYDGLQLQRCSPSQLNNGGKRVLSFFTHSATRIFHQTGQLIITMSLKASKRSSSRISVLSKAMKYVDEDTRRDFRDKRIQSLEADNFDESALTQADDDAAYGEDDVSLQKKLILECGAVYLLGRCQYFTDNLLFLLMDNRHSVSALVYRIILLCVILYCILC